MQGTAKERGIQQAYGKSDRDIDADDELSPAFEAWRNKFGLKMAKIDAEW